MRDGESGRSQWAGQSRGSDEKEQKGDDEGERKSVSVCVCVPDKRQFDVAAIVRQPSVRCVCVWLVVCRKKKKSCSSEWASVFHP